MHYSHYPSGERFIPFLGPFLLGGIGGAAIVAATRPRYYPAYYPVPYQPMPYQPMPYSYSYGYGYGTSPYNYY